MIIEVCCSNIFSVQNAQKANVDRIELCSELSLSGITPSFGFINKALKTGMNLHCLIRPRSGGFIYREEELEIMYNDIEMIQSMGCNGIVVGALNPDMTINEKAIKKMVRLASSMEVTFHRAIDLVEDPFRVLSILMNLGVDRVLSSGQKSSAIEGLKTLIKMKDFAGDRITIMPGGGINSENCMVFKKAGFEAIHFSAFRAYEKKESSSIMSSLFDQALGESDIEEIHKIKDCLQSKS